MRPSRVKHAFVEFVPDELERATLYVSMEYGTVVHICLCGCGNPVVTPLSPTDWRLIYDGDTITLAPSVGNWSFPCQSHYVIRRSEVTWAGPMSREQIESTRDKDRCTKQAYYGAATASHSSHQEADTPAIKKTWWSRLLRW